MGTQRFKMLKNGRRQSIMSRNSRIIQGFYIILDPNDTDMSCSLHGRVVKEIFPFIAALSSTVSAKTDGTIPCGNVEFQQRRDFDGSV